MRVISSFHDFANACAPSRCSWSASASVSMPALANFASTASASPPSSAITLLSSPCSAKARSVFSGMVSMVSAAARASMYKVSDALGSLVPVLAHSRGELLPARRREQLAVCAVGSAADGDAESIAQLRRHLVGHRLVPSAHEQRGDGRDARVSPSGDAALDATQIRFGRGDVLLAREQQGHVDRYPVKDRFLDRRTAFRRARNLDVQIRTLGLGVDTRGCGDAARGVVGQQRRYFHRYPAVDAVGRIEDRTAQIGGPSQIFERQLHEERFTGFSRLCLVANALVVGGGIADRLVENGRVRGQARDRELVDVTAQRAVVENFAGDVVQPETLAEVVQLLCLVHGRSWFVAATPTGEAARK